MKMKKWLVAALVCIAVGAIGFVAVLGINNWEFSIMSTGNYETNIHEINENFENINIETSTADIKFIISEDNTKVECYENVKRKHKVEVKDNTLYIQELDERKWYEYISFTFKSPILNVYLSQTQFNNLVIHADTSKVNVAKDFSFNSIDIKTDTGDIDNYASCAENMTIKASTGDITVDNVSCKSLSLSVSTGRVEAKNIICSEDVKIKVSTGKTILTNLKCKNLSSDGDTGNITLNNVIASENIDIERSTGDVKFVDSDGGNIYVETDTGRVSGTLLTDKIFITRTDTGRVNVPNSTNGGRCEIKTDTGDIIFEISK